MLLMLLSACQYPSASVIPTSPVPTQETGQEVFCDSWDEEWISSNHDLTDTIIDGKRSVEIDLSITSQAAGCKGLDLSLLLDSTVSSSQIELDVLNSWLGSDQELSTAFEYDEHSHELLLDISRWDCTGKRGTGEIFTILIGGYEGIHSTPKAQFLRNGVIIMIDNVDG